MTKTKKKYLERSRIDPRIIRGESEIHGQGMLAATPIRAGEKLMVWGGTTVSKKDFREEDWRYSSLVPVDEETYLGLPSSHPVETMDEFLNHSCDPSGWLVDEVTVVARRNIKAGEEITVDSATWDDGADEYSDDDRCTCNSVHCRKILKGDDWKRKDLQKRYAGHFSPFIQDRIEKLG